MFMCKHCLQQFEDEQLAYTLLPEGRKQTSPDSVAFFEMKFCSLKHTQEFLHRIQYQQMRYILTKKGKDGESDKVFEPALPADLLLIIGSSAS